jgi:hypothetical protein
MSRKKKRGSTNAPSGGPTPLPPADEFPDGPLTVPGVHHPRTTLPLPTALSDAPDGQNDWPNDAVRPVWDREVTVAREAPLSEEAKALLLHGDESPTAEDVLAAIDQAGPPVSRTPTLAGIPAAEIPVAQNVPSTLTGIPARQPDEPVTPDEMPPGAAELAAVPVVELGLQATIRMPEQSPAPAPEQQAVTNEFDADEKTPLPKDNVPFGGDSGMRPMPTSPADPNQGVGQETVGGLMATPLDEALKDAEPPMPVLDAVSLSGGVSPSAPVVQDFEQAPSTQPGIVVDGQFVSGIRDMMPQRDEAEEADSDASSDGVVQGGDMFGSSGIARGEALNRQKPVAPAPENVFPATPPLPADVRRPPIKLETLFKTSHAAGSAALAPTAPMEAVKPEPVPADVPPPVTEAPATSTAQAVPEPVTEAPSASPVVVPVEQSAPAEPVPAPSSLPVQEAVTPVTPVLPEKPATPQLFIVPPSAEVQLRADAEPDYTEIVRGLKRKNILRYLPWVIGTALAVVIAVAVGLGSRLYSVRQTDTDTAVYNEAVSTCAQVRAQRAKIPLDQATRDCVEVTDRLLSR